MFPGFIVTVSIVLLFASISPVESYILPLFALIALSNVCCSYAFFDNSFYFTNCIITNLQIKNKNIAIPKNNKFLIFFFEDKFNLTIK